MKAMSFARFRVYTLGSNRPEGFRGNIRELWESDDESRFAILSTVGDGTAYLLLMARDTAGRFVGAGTPRMFASLDGARSAVLDALTAPLGVLRDPGFPGMDLFRPVVPTARLHDYFRRLDIVPHSRPALRVLKEITPWLRATDPHFIREFQTQGFDQRLWEIYLWACFRENGFTVDQREHPDFVLRRSGRPIFSVEATTAAPSLEGVLADHPDPQTQEEMAAFLRDYMPMKFGGPLTGKLNKRFEGGVGYWGLPEAAGVPFLIAIADFHVASSKLEPGSMVYSQSALPLYLYGTEYNAELDGSGRLEIGYRKLLSHTFKSKKIESGFFDLPEAEHVAGVLFSNAGTMSKFTRMGVLAGFGGGEFRYIRRGFLADPDPNAMAGQPFAVDVSHPAYREGWGDELQVFHNPNAVQPLDPALLPNATHHRWKNDQVVSISPPLSVLTSVTFNIRATDDPAGEAERLEALLGQV